MCFTTRMGTRLISSDIVDDLQARVSVVVELGTLVHAHAELRMEQRSVTEVDVRAMLERATGFEPSVVGGRFMIHVVRNNRPWVVIVEPDTEASLLVVVTVYEVSE